MRAQEGAAAWPREACLYESQKFVVYSAPPVTRTYGRTCNVMTSRIVSACPFTHYYNHSFRRFLSRVYT